MRLSRILLVAVVGLAGCSGDDDDGDPGCSDSGTIAFTLTPAGGAEETNTFTCGFVFAVGTQTYAAYSPTSGGASAELGEAQVIMDGSPAPIGTFQVTSSGVADFAYYSPGGLGAPEGFARDCTTNGGVTNNGSITISASSASSIEGSFSIPSLCDFGTVEFTGVSGTFSYP